MQACDLDRILQTQRDCALGRERNHLRDEIFECVQKLNVAEPSQLRPLLERLYKACAALSEHVNDVESHFGVKS